jgi:hypothetical protein
MIRLWYEVDVRSVLLAVRVPALVIARAGNATFPALAGPGEILVSRTIRDLVAGAPIRLESRGSHQLKGVPGSWEVFAVVS